MAAETPEEVARLAGHFTRTARAVRQILALKARMVRDALRHDREDEALATAAANATVQARRARIETTLTRIIRSGNVGYRAQALCDDVRTRLDEEALFDAFLDEDVEDQVDRLCEALGLSPVQDQDKAGEDGNPVLSPSRSPAAVARPPGSWPPRHEAPTGDQRREDGYG